jgi:hypothetical protein
VIVAIVPLSKGIRRQVGRDVDAAAGLQRKNVPQALSKQELSATKCLSGAFAARPLPSPA